MIGWVVARPWVYLLLVECREVAIRRGGVGNPSLGLWRVFVSLALAPTCGGTRAVLGVLGFTVACTCGVRLKLLWAETR